MDESSQSTASVLEISFALLDVSRFGAASSRSLAKAHQ